MGRDGKEKGELGSAHQLFSAQKLNWGRGRRGKGKGGVPPPQRDGLDPPVVRHAFPVAFSVGAVFRRHFVQ